MNNILIATLPLIGMFLGLTAIVKYHFSKLEKRITELENKINKLEKD